MCEENKENSCGPTNKDFAAKMHHMRGGMHHMGGHGHDEMKKDDDEEDYDEEDYGTTF